MKKIALFGIIVFTISLPFQWLYLENPFVSAASTIVDIYLILRYNNYLK